MHNEFKKVLVGKSTQMNSHHADIQHVESSERVAHLCEEIEANASDFSTFATFIQPDLTEISLNRVTLPDAERWLLYKSLLEVGFQHQRKDIVLVRNLSRDVASHSAFIKQKLRKTNINTDNVIDSGTKNSVLSYLYLCRQVIKEMFNQSIQFGCALGRPPGHHSAYDCSGFCFLNYAFVVLQKSLKLLSGKEWRRIVVLDWDAHCGDGTIKLIVDLLDKMPLLKGKILYAGTHVKSSFPFSDQHQYHSVSRSILGLPSVKPEIEENFIIQEYELSTTSEEFLCLWEHILARCDLSSTDLVIASIGFDGHQEDPLMGGSLDDSTYNLLLDSVLNECLWIRNVPRDKPAYFFSLLEGGYSPTVVSRLGISQVRAMGHKWLDYQKATLWKRVREKDNLKLMAQTLLNHHVLTPWKCLSGCTCSIRNYGWQFHCQHESQVSNKYLSMGFGRLDDVTFLELLELLHNIEMCNFYVQIKSSMLQHDQVLREIIQRKISTPSARVYDILQDLTISRSQVTTISSK